MLGTHPNIVCIVITGYATIESAVEAMKRGAFDFLPKPFTPDELRLIVNRGIEQRRLLLETTALREEKERMKQYFITIVAHELGLRSSWSSSTSTSWSAAKWGRSTQPRASCSTARTER